MQYIDINGAVFSRLTLGTAQLGMQYGIANEGGVPSIETSMSILSEARRMGINTLDTAGNYGKSESTIGSFMERNPGEKPFNVITKFKVSNENLLDAELAWFEVKRSVQQSFQRIKNERFSVILFHCGADQLNASTLNVLPLLLHRIKRNGWADLTGFSMYDSSSAALLKDIDEIDIIQLPLNIFDQRLIREGTLESFQESEKLIFARSIFLQGLFFKSPAELSGNLVAAQVHLDQLRNFAERAAMSIAQLAFAFVRDQPGIHSLVIGAERTDQIKQNVEMLMTPPIPGQILEEIKAYYRDLDEVICTPGKWRFD